MMNVPVGVMSGKSPMKSSCSLTSPVSLTISSTLTRSGAANVASRSRHSASEYFGSPKEYSPKRSSILEPVKSWIGEISSSSSRRPSRTNHS